MSACSNSSEVWFVLPTANADNAARHLPIWRDMGYRVAVLQDRTRFDCDADAVVYADTYPGWPATVNRLFREVIPAHVQVIVSGGDDMLPDPNLRAHEIAEQFLEYFHGSFGVMQPHGDDFEDTREFCGSPWLGREWMQRMYMGFGGMCDRYTHHFADDELYWVSRCTGKLWSRPDLIQAHDHFRRRGEDAPEYWLESVQAHDRDDTRTFMARAASGFPGHEAVGADAPKFDHALFRAEYKGRAEQYWLTHHAKPVEINAGPSAEDRMTLALAWCAQHGAHRVAIYGAGAHTTRVAPSLRQPPVEIAAIIDDNPELHGQHLWGFPVVSTQAALGLNLDAVVLSSDTVEDKLAASAAPLADAGVRIVPLYAKPTQPAAQLAG